jgi:hypothetical protein
VGIVVNKIRNGMPAVLLDAGAWRKSSYSGAIGNCVEVAILPDDLVAVRNSRNPGGPALVCPHAEIAALVAGLNKC